MIRTLVIGLATVVAMAFIHVDGGHSAAQQAKPSTEAFLKEVAEMCQAKSALGQLAAERTANKRVAQFVERMNEAHRRIGQEVQLLASRHDVKLPSELSEEHKQKLKGFSSLSGHAFDREYLRYMLRDLQNEVNEFEDNMQVLEDPDVFHWAYRIIPTLKAHIEDARELKYALQTNP
jgi:putative membrane protein